MTDALILDGLVKTYGPLRAVDGLSLRVPRGSITGFLGPNGAGKTTTLRMIMDIFPPDTGRIELLGRPLSRDGLAHVGYMPEERGLYPKMKVRALLQFFGELKGLDRTTLAREIPLRLEDLGLADRAECRVEELSRGMQQKLQFIVTTINDPQLLILDEPFSGLDPVNLELLEGIIQRMRVTGTTVLFSTHMMEHAERICDRVVLLSRGRKLLDDELTPIRTRHAQGRVLVSVYGDTDFIDTLPMVREAVRRRGHLDILLADGADPQTLLRALIDRAQVRRFEQKLPTLHEIFIELVGAER